MTTAAHAVADHGGDGPALVFLHAFMMNREQFAKQVGSFGADYRVITIDERGHGESKTEKDFDFWDLARDVIAVLEHLDVNWSAPPRPRRAKRGLRLCAGSLRPGVRSVPPRSSSTA